MKHKLEIIFGFFADVFRNREMLFALAKNDIKVRYLGSYLGILWAVIQPLFSLCIMWFVFSVGFKTVPVDGVPFILWLSAGMIPWFFLSDAMVSTANSILENSYLVKKVVFRVALLPLIKILSATFIHIFFLGFLLFMFVIHGYWPDIFYLQIFYYFFSAVFLMVGFSFITSAFTVFMRDFGQFVGVGVQLLFWGTPIFWSLKMIPVSYAKYFYLNPIIHITEGYREALIYHVWFWQHPIRCLYFWSVAVVLFGVGAFLFHRLKPHFADVL